MTELSAEMLAAILTDDAKAERLTELLAQEKANKTTLAAAQAASSDADGKIAEARSVLAAARAIEDGVAAKREAVAEVERAAAEVLTALNTEKDDFNRIRAQVEADLDRRTKIVNAKESELSRREAELSSREAEAEAREHLTKDAEGRALKLHEAVEAAISAHRGA